MKRLAAICLLGLLSGCQMLDQYKLVHVQDLDKLKQTPAEQQQQQPEDPIVCLVEGSIQHLKHNCDHGYWLSFWVEEVVLPWPERKKHISTLGDNLEDKLKKILLSQGKGTPYQDRLRAQSWLEQIEPELSLPVQKILQVLVYQPSQELLEFESALAILTRLNSNQAKELETQQQLLEEQREQIEQLLKIEASMMEKREGINQ